MFGVIFVHVGTVVIIPAAHFDDRIDAAKHVAFRRGVGDGPRRVELLDVILHRARDVGGLRRVLHHELLVGDAPNRDARMIAVAADLVVPLFHVPRIAAHQPALVHDQHAEPVAGIEQFRRGRIVRGADGVAAEFLQFLHAEFLQRIREWPRRRRRDPDDCRCRKSRNACRSAKSRWFGSKRHGADAKGSCYLVNHFAGHGNGRDELVKFWRFRRPKNRRGNIRFQFHQRPAIRVLIFPIRKIVSAICRPAK